MLSKAFDLAFYVLIEERRGLTLAENRPDPPAKVWKTSSVRRQQDLEDFLECSGQAPSWRKLSTARLLETRRKIDHGGCLEGGSSSSWYAVLSTQASVQGCDEATRLLRPLLPRTATANTLSIRKA